MAKPSWLTVSPTSGSGNGTIQNSASEHTGRVARTGTVTVTASGLATPQTYTVSQSPKAEFVSFDNGATMAASKEASTVTVTGLSNSSSLTFAWVGDNGGVELPATYTAAGSSATSGAAIADDPGASAQYAFSIALSFPENDSVDEVLRTLKVTDAAGNTAQIAITQSAGDPTLTVSPLTITIPQDGTAQTVSVTSNTSWTVS